jgi:alkanesulfonate monooxygenase SsuD/methylene tetrahydromethanopterin reductase-like flavin-dependent oxidoreductase (luciferase family)
MEFGLFLECNRSFEAAIEASVLAERPGFSSIWISEHHNIEGYVGSPLVALAAIAMRTARARLGPFVRLMPSISRFGLPRTARWWTGSRRVLSFWRSGSDKWRRNSDARHPDMERASRMEEGVEVVKRLWTERQVNFAGRSSSWKGAIPDRSRSHGLHLAGKVDRQGSQQGRQARDA